MDEIKPIVVNDNSDEMMEILHKVKNAVDEASKNKFNLNEQSSYYYDKWKESINEVLNENGYELVSMDYKGSIVNIKVKPKDISTISIDLNIL